MSDISPDQNTDPLERGCYPEFAPPAASDEALLKGDPKAFHEKHCRRLASALREKRISAVEASLGIAAARDSMLKQIIGEAFAGSNLHDKVCFVEIGGSGERTSCSLSDIDGLWLSKAHPSELPGYTERRLAVQDRVFKAELKLDNHAWQIGDFPNLEDPKGLERVMAVLTRRHLWGSRELFEQFEQQLAGFIRGSMGDGRPRLQRILELLEAETQRRYVDSGDEASALYGDKKEGRGGYRCMTVVSACVKLAKLFRSEIEESDLLSEGEWQQYARARETVLALRHGLHFSGAGGSYRDYLFRNNERAVMLAVPWLAGAASPAEEPDRVIFHQNIVQSAVTLSELLKKIQVNTALSTAGAEILTAHECLGAIHGAIFNLMGDAAIETPGAAGNRARCHAAGKCIEAFAVLQRHSIEHAEDKFKRLPVLDRKAIMDVALTAHLLEERQLQIEAGQSSPFRSEAAARQFREILGHAGHVGETVASLHEKGILSFLLPCFARLRGTVVRESRYDRSLDGHLLAALKALDSVLLRDEPRLSDYLTSVKSTTQIRIKDPPVLYLALLLHDIEQVEGRDPGRGGHAARGAEVAYVQALALGFEEERAQRVAKLVRLHPLMTETSQRRMVNSPRVVREFCEQVGDADMLNMLLLHTWADKQTSSSSDWISKATHRAWLALLYESAQCFLREGHVQTPEREELVRKLAGALLPQLDHRTPASAIVQMYVRNHLDCLPARYAEQCSAQEICDHLSMISEFENGQKSKRPPVAVLKWQFPDEAQNDDESAAASPHGYKSVRLSVVSRDAPGLFSRICGGISFNISGARIFTRSDGLVCNIFYLDVPAGILPIDVGNYQREILKAVSAGDSFFDEVFASQRKRNQTRPYAGQPVSVKIIDEDEISRVEIHASDQEKLAFAMGRSLSVLGLNIINAKLSIGSSGAWDFFEVDRIPAEKHESVERTIKEHVELLWNP